MIRMMTPKTVSIVNDETDVPITKMLVSSLLMQIVTKNVEWCLNTEYTIRNDLVTTPDRNILTNGNIPTEGTQWKCTDWTDAMWTYQYADWLDWMWNKDNARRQNFKQEAG